MKTVETAIDDRIVSTDDIIVGEDARGNSVTHYALAERVLQTEYWLIQQEILEDPSAASETLIYMLEGGFRGFHNQSSGELWSEWTTKQEVFWELYDTNRLPWDLYGEDPLGKTQ